MPETVRKLDSRRRAVFPDCFAPGDLFIEEEVGENRVVFKLIRKDDVPVAKLEMVDGTPMIRAEIDRAQIGRAIRADRDAR
ncbi:MAG: hypothetical protein ACI8T1_002249 [Verrucomicrobiales bacterium]|jgi:hypothetical protein